MLLQNAIDDGRARNYDAAVRKLKKLLEKTDEYDEALLYLGRAYHEMGNFNEAIISFRYYIGRAPKSSAGYFYLGRTYIAGGLFSRAASCFSESLRLKKDFAPSLAYMGYALMRTGALHKSVDYLKEAVKRAPEDKKIYTMYINSLFFMSLKEFRDENFNAALNGLLFIEKAGFISITTKLYIGIILKEMQNFREAVSYIEDALEFSPDDVLIKNILAELYMRNADMEKAFTLLKSYMNENQIKSFIDRIEDSERDLAVSFWNKKDYQPAFHFATASLKKKRTSEMHLLAGECLKELGRLDDAYNHYCRAHGFDKNSIEPLYGQAVILWLKDEYSGMLDCIAKIERINSEDDFAVYYRVLCSSRLGIPFSEWKDILKNISGYDNDPWLLSAAGYGEALEKNYSSSAKYLRKSLKIDNSRRETWLMLIDVLEKDNTETPLMTALKQYLKLFSEDTQKRELYSELLYKNERFAAAADEYRLLMSSENADFKYLFRYAYCCRKAGRYGEASITYRQILTMDPYNEKYLKMLLYCMRKDGKDSKTIPLLRQAVIAFTKPSVDLLLVYGTTLYRNGFDEEALSVFQNCIYNGYKDWRVFRNMGIIYRKKGLEEWSEMYFKKAEKLKKN